MCSSSVVVIAENWWNLILLTPKIVKISPIARQFFAPKCLVVTGLVAYVVFKDRIGMFCAVVHQHYVKVRPVYWLVWSTKPCRQSREFLATDCVHRQVLPAHSRRDHLMNSVCRLVTHLALLNITVLVVIPFSTFALLVTGRASILYKNSAPAVLKVSLGTQSVCWKCTITARVKIRL